jgi:hypothetical protein
VRGEDVAHVGLEHRLEVASDQPGLAQVRERHAPHESVHVTPRDAGAHGIEDLPLRVEHGLIHDALVGAELVAEREGARDVRRVELVLTSHVE